MGTIMAKIKWAKKDNDTYEYTVDSCWTVTNQQTLNSRGAAGRCYIKLIMILGGQNERQLSVYFLLSVPVAKIEYECMKTIIPWRTPLSFCHGVSKNYNLYKSIIK